MNRYLEKIAKEKDYIIETAATGAGAGLVRHQYHAGNITGRASYYHGSTQAVTDKIKSQGIVPRASKGVIDHMGGNFADVNKGLAFATKTKSTAHGYARQADTVAKGTFQKGPGQLKSFLQGHLDSLGDSLGVKKDKGVTRLNIPDWKHEIKSKAVQNPETAGVQGLFKDRATLHELDKQTLTHKGTIGAKWVKGSKHYQANSFKEIKEFAKHAPKRFATGTGIAAAGLGIVGLAARSAKNKYLDKAASMFSTGFKKGKDLIRNKPMTSPIKGANIPGKKPALTKPTGL